MYEVSKFAKEITQVESRIRNKWSMNKFISSEKLQKQTIRHITPLKQTEICLFFKFWISHINHEMPFLQLKCQVYVAHKLTTYK